MSLPLPSTGWAAPALVPGAIAAMSADIRMKKPAEAAWAPLGATKITTGVRAPSTAVVMSRVEVISPPAVSSSTITAAAPRRSASWMASAISSAETGWIGDFTVTTSTSPAWPRRAGRGQRRQQGGEGEGEEGQGQRAGGFEGWAHGLKLKYIRGVESERSESSKDLKDTKGRKGLQGLRKPFFVPFVL